MRADKGRGVDLAGNKNKTTTTKKHEKKNLYFYKMTQFKREIKEAE